MVMWPMTLGTEERVGGGEGVAVDDFHKKIPAQQRLLKKNRRAMGNINERVLSTIQILHVF